MLDKIVNDGRKLITIIDPHSKVEDEYWIYREMKMRDISVKNKENEDYITDCWPKESVYFDYFNPKTIDYIKSLYSTVPEDEVEIEDYIWNDPNVLIWNDMNEPACFNNNEGTIPKNCL